MRGTLPARLAAVLILLLTFAEIPCLAQTDDAAISGRITDPTGAVVPGVTVQLQSAERGTKQETTTNRDGIYLFPAVQPGVYHMTARKEGFRQVDYVGLTANVQAHIEQNFRLQVGSSSESITVTADAVNVNTTDATVSTVVDQKFVANMPLNGRSLQDLMTLAPGVATVVSNTGNGSNGPGITGSITVNGQRTESNYFTVDGVSANLGVDGGPYGLGATGFAGATPATTVLGTTQSMVSVDALQEFRASTSTYSAEYGRTPGGQFAFTTRSGANAWHGSLYDYFRNEAFDSNNWFLDETKQPKEKERQNDFGGTLGGPIIIPGLYNGKDKTFFFFSYEGLRLWTPEGIERLAVPDLTLRKAAPAALQPILNAMPLPNAGEDGLNDGLAFYTIGISSPSTIDAISARIDHSIGSKFKIFGRYAYTPSVSSSPAGALNASNVGNYRLVTLGATAMITPRQTNELRFNFTQNDAKVNWESTDFGGATPFDLSTIPGPGGKPFPETGSRLLVIYYYGGCSSRGVICPNIDLEHDSNTQKQINVTDTYTWAVNRHNFKFGIDWRRLSTYSLPYIVDEDIGYFSEASILNNIPDFADVAPLLSSGVEPVYKNFSAFAEDEWKVTSRLSLSLGLRWDVNPPPTNARGPSPYTMDQITNLATTKLAPEGTPLWRTDWHGFAPRFGMAYQLRQTPGHETVIRGGVGMFYDLGNILGSQGFDGFGLSNFVQYPGASFPLTSAQLQLPPPSVAPPYSNLIYAFDPGLRLPYTLQWNVAVEQLLGRDNALTVSYVGSAGRRLLTTFDYAPESLGNPNFDANVCGGCLIITKNGATSDYDALQVNFQRHLSHGLQALASYTWSHSIDTGTTNFQLSELERASSDFDIRNNFQAALTYDIPGSYSNPVLSGILRHWGLDTRIMAQSGSPVDVVGTQALDPLTNSYLNYHPDIVPGQPLYVYGSQYPGGRVLNYNAYRALPDGVEGNSGRNSAEALGAWQINLALRREFPLHDRLRLQFRAEAFNLFNHPNFSVVDNYLPDGPCGPLQPGQQYYCFGTALQTLNDAIGGLNPLYQIGGPRSLQLALKLSF
jgi:Carboxypeptidase regulatory-like domain/TonB dependent receptor